MTDLFLIHSAEFTGRNYSSVTNGFVDYTFEMDYTQTPPVQKHGNLTVDEYVKREGFANGWYLIDPDRFYKMYAEKERELYLTGPVKITDEDYDDALNVLPPENWTRTGPIEHFRMMEYTTGSITNQYARMGDKYICKPIDATDKSTWITEADFENARVPR